MYTKATGAGARPEPIREIGWAAVSLQFEDVAATCSTPAAAGWLGSGRS